MESDNLIPSLALFTLIAAILIAVVGFVLFKRKPANRHPMEKSGDDTIAMVSTENSQVPPTRTVRSTEELESSDQRPSGNLNRRP